MIQRKQTIFLLLALLSLIVCLCLPIGKIEPQGMGVMTIWYNLGLVTDGMMRPQPMLFVDLVVTGILAFIAIFMFKKRKVQARLCSVSMVLCLAWYAYYAFCVLNEFQTGGTFRIAFAACLPLVAFILLYLARRGVIADEKLVRSMDRIR
ncbi:hypothetical protein HMPREF1870_01874 [Bacteroidales bacterium KA00344]|nr:hypothetical protein HMPREF1870_01874 [Bacteroidales bacterium KA00344]